MINKIKYCDIPDDIRILHDINLRLKASVRENVEKDIQKYSKLKLDLIEKYKGKYQYKEDFAYKMVSFYKDKQKIGSFHYI